MRRDGRPDPHRRDPNLAWSQLPPAPPRRNPPPRGNPPYQPPPRRRTTDDGVRYAPTQRPEPFTDDRRQPPPRRTGRSRPAPPARSPRPPRQARSPRHGRPLWRRLLGPGLGTKLLVTAVALLFSIVVTLIWVDRSLNRIDALADYDGRPGSSVGTNWLLVGSDSRVGLTPDQEQELTTGGDVGPERTDTIILIHIPRFGGHSTMVSIPRDSYVSIPGNGKDKINAAYAFGGPQLLVQTVEGATGLRIDHYAEIGFGGFAGMVDAIGGLDICVKQPMDDPMAGINLAPGCQELDGTQALGFVRSRYVLAGGDLDRIQNQRQFLSALLSKATSPSTLLNPFRLWPLITGTTRSLTVDSGDHVWSLASLGWALRDNPVTTTVPVSGTEDVDGSGNVLLWDRSRAGPLFDDLAHDRALPAELITTGGS
ncbi:LCP family protein [Skermania piniformis]|uniref:LCP family protein n=1 Tax=Skermania pinensis TaxID=39122 RepID=A0ABX8SCJ3_9ACTN|nr:LCP family protein [Skermania piniformis]